MKVWSKAIGKHFIIDNKGSKGFGNAADSGNGRRRLVVCYPMVEMVLAMREMASGKVPLARMRSMVKKEVHRHMGTPEQEIPMMKMVVVVKALMEVVVVAALLGAVR